MYNIVENQFVNDYIDIKLFRFLLNLLNLFRFLEFFILENYFYILKIQLIHLI